MAIARILVPLFVCLWFLSHSRVFHLYEDITITDKGQQRLTYARLSRPLRSEVSLAFYTTIIRGIRL